jgi:hypothetical protein
LDEKYTHQEESTRRPSTANFVSGQPWWSGFGDNVLEKEIEEVFCANMEQSDAVVIL